MIAQLAPAVDHAILDVSHLGGITQAMKAAAALDVLNIPVSTHSYNVISMHLLGGIRTGAWLEYMDWWNPLFTNAPEPVNGYLQLPEGPGLGLELNEQLLREKQV